MLLSTSLIDEVIQTISGSPIQSFVSARREIPRSRSLAGSPVRGCSFESTAVAKFDLAEDPIIMRVNVHRRSLLAS